MAENIERIFNDDIREKRKAGSGSFHKRGKGVKHGLSGALKTPFHYMKAKEKRALDGEVETYNMYETILTREEFELKDQETQKHMLTRWREIYPNQKIMDEMARDGSRKFNTQSFADLVNGLGCPPKIRGGSEPKKYKQRQAKAKSVAIEQNKDEVILNNQIQETVKQDPIKILADGLHLEYNGDYTAEQLSKIFTKLQLLTDGEDNKFCLSISLSERA